VAYHRAGRVKERLASDMLHCTLTWWDTELVDEQ